MFDLFFRSASAFNQVMLLVMAFSFTGLGSLLLGHEIYWRVRALRVVGTVIGVREIKPNMYRTVYQYSLPGSSETIQATSDTGSNSPNGRDTDSRVELLVFADRPEQVSEARKVLVAFFGALFFAIGFWPLHVALTSWPVTAFTWFMLVGWIGFIALRLKARLIPKADRSSSLSSWRSELRAKNRARLDAIPIRPIEAILTSPELVARRAKEEATYRFLRPFLVLAGFGAIALSLHLARGVAQLEKGGLRAAGTVVSLREESGSDSSTYHAIVRFSTKDDEAIEFKDRMGSNPPSYRVGEKVSVLYESVAPAASATIDRGKWNWLPPAALGAFGCVLIYAALRFKTRSSTRPQTL